MVAWDRGSKTGKTENVLRDTGLTKSNTEGYLDTIGKNLNIGRI